jgi:hypothetical protein
MKNGFNILIASMVILVFVNCTGIHISPHFGHTNTNPAREYATIASISKGGGLYHNSEVPGQISNADTTKVGESCSQSILWLVAWGDSSINSARLNGKINKIGMVTYDVRAFFGFFYHEFCTIVRGE